MNSNNKPRIFLTFEPQDKTKEFLSEKFDYDFWDGPRPVPEEELKNKIKDSEVLICSPTDEVGSEVIEAGENLKVIGTRTAGYDHIDLEKANKRGIKVVRVSGPITEGVAEFVVGAMISLARGIHQGSGYIREKNWGDRSELYKNPWKTTLLKGKKAGIVGMGTIGKRLTEVLSVFGMDILYYNRSRKKDIEEKYDAKYFDLKTLASKSDYVISAISLNEETKHMFDEDIFKEMKKYSTFVNIARGGVVNTDDLIQALKNDQIKNTALDVYEEEPLPKDSEIFDIDRNRVLMTPHIAGMSMETGRDAGLQVVKDAYSALRGEETKNLVNA